MNQKVAILKIGEGHIKEGFAVNLRIKEFNRDEIEIDGRLPAAPELSHLYEDWEDSYSIHHLGCFSRQAPQFRSLQSNKNIKTNISLKESAENLERYLDRWLNNGSEEFRPIREGWLHHLNAEDSIRFIIQAKDKLFFHLPWHLCDLFQRYPHSDIALSLSQKPRHTRTTLCKSKVKILVVLGEATNINVQADLELLRDRLPTNAQLIEPLIATNRATLDAILWKEQIDIFFFAGHSNDRDRYGLKAGQFYLSDDEGLSIEDLKYSLKNAIKRGLKLAIFNSCRGVKLAQDLADLRMPAIVVMRQRIRDEVAQQFLEYFIEAFAQKKKSLYLAVREARERLHGLNNTYPCASWFPVLCQHPAADDLTWMGMVKPRFSLLRLLKKVSLVYYLTAALTVSLAIAGGWLTANPLSKYLHKQGANCFENNRVECAEKYFNWALKFNPNNDSAFNNLGLIYESHQNYERAREYFHEAKLRGNIAACNNEARLEIIDGRYKKAETLLEFCLPQVNTAIGEYSMLKNLGWTLFEQENYDEAKRSLQEAIRIEGMHSKGTANCLLAQVLEIEKELAEALIEWQYCLNSSVNIDEEKKWMNLAKERIQQLEE